MARGGNSKGGGDRLVHFISGSRIKPFIKEDLRAVIENPIKFRTTHGQLTTSSHCNGKIIDLRPIIIPGPVHEFHMGHQQQR